MEKTIYEKGIKFQCQGSANCCVSRGSYGFVFLSKKDLSRLAKYFNISLKEFKTYYCQSSDGFTHLKEIKKKGECINFCPGIGKGKIISKKKIDKLLTIDEINAEEIYREKN